MDEICKYCKKPLQKIDCVKDAKLLLNCQEDFISLHEIITFFLWFFSLLFPSYKKKLQNHKYKITCVNKDCIGFLDGCKIRKICGDFFLK